MRPLFAAMLFLAAGVGSGETRPPILGIAHIAFEVSDLKKARTFYGELLGYEEAYHIQAPDGRIQVAVFKINERQYVEIMPGLPAEKIDRLSHVAFETSDIERLHAYLKEKGIAVPERIEHGRDGNRLFVVSDPDRHFVEFVQYLPDSLPSRTRGRYQSSYRISDRMLHVGLTVADVAAADKFYKDVLGFSEIWRGGANESVTNWINMKVPDGTDYLEYMLVTDKPDRQRLGSLHHMALLVPDIQRSLEELRRRPMGNDPGRMRTPQVGRNRRYQLNLFDPDGSRTELMEPFPIR